MKLVYIANVRIPTEKAHGVQITKMCEAFANAGLEVTLLVPKRFNYTKGDPFLYHNVKSNFKITKIPCLDLIIFDKFLGKFAFWVQTLSFLFFAKIYLIGKRYEIIYTRERFVGLFFKKFVLELHSLPGKFKFWYKWILKRTNKIVVLTSFIKNDLVQAGVNDKKILVASDAVSLESFSLNLTKQEARKVVGLPAGGILLGYVGALQTMGMEKGVDVLLAAMQEIKDAQLVLVGGNKKEISKYQRLADKLGVINKIKFIPKVKYDLVPFYLKSFDILLAPYPKGRHFEYFMSPLKIFEYLAAGRPIIASDLPSIREILNEKNAVLVKAQSAEDLSLAIKRVLEDKNLANNIGNQAQIDSKKYTWSVRVMKILSFVKK